MPTLQGQTYDFAKFSEKPREIEKSRGEGDKAPGASLVDA